MAQKEINIGDIGPDFTLNDQDGKPVTLSAFRGKKVVLGFHPLAWTGVCAQQMQDLEANYDTFERLGAVAFGISIDSSFTKHNWAKSLGITRTRLLADFWPHGAVASSYGVFNEDAGVAKRAVLVLDPSGKVAYKRIYPNSQVPDIKEVVSFIEKM